MCPAEVGNTSVTALLFKRGNKNDVNVVLNVRSNSTQVGHPVLPMRLGFTSIKTITGPSQPSVTRLTTGKHQSSCDSVYSRTVP